MATALIPRRTKIFELNDADSAREIPAIHHAPGCVLPADSK
jgi:hypothetical protein